MTRAPMLTAADIMSSRPVAVHSDASIAEAIGVLLRKDLSGLPVVDHERRLVGILSERDCLRVLAVGQYSDADHERLRSVDEFMSAPTYTAAPEAGLYSLADFFLTHHQRRLPILVQDRLVGIVSRRDVLRGIQEMIRRRALPLPAELRGPSLYPSAADTSPGVLGTRLDD
ncbi:MAG: CBS domain-containing protein [Gemmatimonadota bacterium]|nr:CBS domain-containing protein [Gemmatimonadota bacterium]